MIDELQKTDELSGDKPSRATRCYTFELDKIYCENCLDTMAKMPNDFIDLVVTSPPYDDLRDYEGYEFDFESIAHELYRVIKPGGVVVWVVGDKTKNGSETGSSFRQALYFINECGFSLFDTMIYQKNGPAYPSIDKYFQVFEYMFVLSKGKPKTFNPIEDRFNKWYGQKFSKTRSRRKKDGSMSISTWDKEQGGQYGKRFNIWRYNVGAGYSTKDSFAHEHPAIFPEQLANDHIYSWSNPGDAVYDPMGGSGTTCKMAAKMNRRWVMSELSPKYCDIAQKRIDVIVNQITMDLDA